jgi:calcineurin-like phosphoesterase family protein
MSRVYFIADTHFHHKNILKFEGDKRPFKDLEEHDEEIVKRWNQKITNRDKVFVLGDFSFGSVEIAGRLNGAKVLVMGNHDYKGADEYLKYFTKVYGATTYRGYLLTHIPVHESQKRRYKGNIHGHLHSKVIDDPFYTNVSIEQLPNLQPIEFNELIKQDS